MDSCQRTWVAVSLEEAQTHSYWCWEAVFTFPTGHVLRGTATGAASRLHWTIYRPTTCCGVEPVWSECCSSCGRRAKRRVVAFPADSPQTAENFALLFPDADPLAQTVAVAMLCDFPWADQPPGSLRREPTSLRKKLASERALQLMKSPDSVAP